MAEPTFEETVDAFKAQSDEQRQFLAGIYGSIMQGMEASVEQARYAAANLSESVRGVTELKQLLSIMDGGFARVASEIIAEAQGATTTEEENPPEA